MCDAVLCLGPIRIHGVAVRGGGVCQHIAVGIEVIAFLHAIVIVVNPLPAVCMPCGIISDCSVPPASVIPAAKEVIAIPVAIAPPAPLPSRP